MIDVSKAARVVTHPVHTAGSIAGRTVGMTLGAARFGVRTTARVVGWAVEQAGGPTPQRLSDTYSPVTVPPATPEPEPTDLTTPSDDPMRPTVTPPRKAPARTAPAKKVPASEVPLKSAPTPSLPAGLDALDAAAGDAPETAPVPARAAAAKKTATRKAPAKKAAATKAPAKKATATTAPVKKAAAKKAPAKKAPSEQAAVLAPALGLSESEVAEVVGGDGDEG